MNKNENKRINAKINSKQISCKNKKILQKMIYRFGLTRTRVGISI